MLLNMPQRQRYTWIPQHLQLGCRCEMQITLRELFLQWKYKPMVNANILKAWFYQQSYGFVKLICKVVTHVDAAVLCVVIEN